MIVRPMFLDTNTHIADMIKIVVYSLSLYYNILFIR